jgi:hypothetical protein
MHEAVGFAVRGADEGQRGMTALVEAVGEVVLQPIATTHLAELPRGFQATGMCEAAGGEGGVGELE